MGLNERKIFTTRTLPNPNPTASSPHRMMRGPQIGLVGSSAGSFTKSTAHGQVPSYQEAIAMFGSTASATATGVIRGFNHPSTKAGPPIAAVPIPIPAINSDFVNEKEKSKSDKDRLPSMSVIESSEADPPTATGVTRSYGQHSFPYAPNAQSQTSYNASYPNPLNIAPHPHPQRHPQHSSSLTIQGQELHLSPSNQPLKSLSHSPSLGVGSPGSSYRSWGDDQEQGEGDEEEGSEDVDSDDVPMMDSLGPGAGSAHRSQQHQRPHTNMMNAHMRTLSSTSTQSHNSNPNSIKLEDHSSQFPHSSPFDPNNQDPLHPQKHRQKRRGIEKKSRQRRVDALENLRRLVHHEKSAGGMGMGMMGVGGGMSGMGMIVADPSQQQQGQGGAQLQVAPRKETQADICNDAVAIILKLRHEKEELRSQLSRHIQYMNNASSNNPNAGQDASMRPV